MYSKQDFCSSSSGSSSSSKVAKARVLCQQTTAKTHLAVAHNMPAHALCDFCCKISVYYIFSSNFRHWHVLPLLSAGLGASPCFTLPDTPL
jgi:hypothetical protein